MNGSTSQADDYYGYVHESRPGTSGKESRKMRRTQLSRERKSNPSVKSLSRERESTLSHNRISRGLVPHATSILKLDTAQYSKNHHSKFGQHNLPSSNDPQNTTNQSIRKSRLQISTGVIGIKMNSLSPPSIVSHPSKVLIVNESTSGKKGSKTKMRKSILYVEYNNFMTELNNNKTSRNSQSREENYSKQNTYVKLAANQQKMSPQMKKQQIQQFSNFLPRDIQNQYFTGMNKNFVPPAPGVLDKKYYNRKTQKILPLGSVNDGQNSKLKDLKKFQSPKNECSKLKSSRSDLAAIHTPKNEITKAHPAINDPLNNLQSQRLRSISPRMFKTEQNANVSKLNKNKISIHQIAFQKERYNQLNCHKSSKIRESREKQQNKPQVVRKQNYGIQVNIAETIFPKDLAIIPSTHQQKKNINQDNAQKQKKEEKKALQKSIKMSVPPTIKQYKTQKQLALSRESKMQSQKQHHKTTYSGVQNPYSLVKNESLINKYQKKKSPAHAIQLANQIKLKGIKYELSNQSPIVQFDLRGRDQMINNFNSNQSESIVSRSSSKGGRKLIKINGGDSPRKGIKSKMSIKSHQRSRLKLIPSPKILRNNHKFEPKTPQPYISYKDSSSQNQEHQINHNQGGFTSQKESSKNYSSSRSGSPTKRQLQIKENKINRIEEYNPAYYTPNPHNFINESKSHNQLNYVPQENQNKIASQLSIDNSAFQSQKQQSEQSQMLSIEDNMSIKSGRRSAVSENRLRTQKKPNNSKIRLSRNSERSNQRDSTKNLKLNPLSQIDSSLDNSMASKIHVDNENSQKQSEEDDHQSSVREQYISEQKNNIKNEEKIQSSTYKGVRLLKMTQIQASSKETRKNSPIRLPVSIKIQQLSQNKSKNLSPTSSNKQKKSQVKASVIKSNIKPQSKIIQSRKYDNYQQPKSVFQSNQQSQNYDRQINQPTKSKSSLSPEKSLLFNKKQTIFLNDSSGEKSNFKKQQLAVQNIQSEIEQLTSSKHSNERMSHTLSKKQGEVEQVKHSFQKIPTKNMSIRQQDSNDLSKSQYSMHSSVNRSGKRQNIKKSIHAEAIHSQNSQMIGSGSKYNRSNISVKSGRNLQPLHPQNATIDEFLAYVDEYDTAIGFLYLYVENTVTFYCNQDNDSSPPKVQQFINKIMSAKSKKYEQKYQKLEFLVLKKYLFEKNRIIKCLRGIEGNVFNLTGLQIPQKIIKKYINHQKTKQKLKQLELQTKELFKKMQQKFRSLRLKAQNKKDKLIKIETPYDDFTRYIVAILMQELNQLTTEIDELQMQTGSKLSSSNPSIPLGPRRSSGPKSLTSVIAQEILTSEQRGIQVMEIVFLLSQLQGRKVKKLELLNLGEIEFQTYYQGRIDELLSTYDFFEGLKYPSDRENITSNGKGNGGR